MDPPRALFESPPSGPMKIAAPFWDSEPYTTEDIPNTIITIPGIEAIYTPYLSALDPQGSSASSLAHVPLWCRAVWDENRINAEKTRKLCAEPRPLSLTPIRINACMILYTCLHTYIYICIHIYIYVMYIRRPLPGRRPEAPFMYAHRSALRGRCRFCR